MTWAYRLLVIYEDADLDETLRQTLASAIAAVTGESAANEYAMFARAVSFAGVWGDTSPHRSIEMSCTAPMLTAVKTALDGFSGTWYAVTADFQSYVDSNSATPGDDDLRGISGNAAQIADAVQSAFHLPAPTPSTLTMPAHDDDLVALASALLPGGTLTLDQGVYTIPAQTWSVPANITIEAAGSARVVIRNADGGAPSIALGTGTTLRNLWIGGDSPSTNGNTMIQAGTGITLDSCVLFNAKQGIIQGGGTATTFSNCVFVNTGEAPFYHALYIGGDLVYNSVITGCVFIGCPSYAIHLYHSAQEITVTNNFVGACNWALVDDGSGHTVTDNVFWSTTGATFRGAGDDTLFTRNAIGRSTSIATTWPAGATITGNYYIERSALVQDAAPVHWYFTDQRAAMGHSYLHIEDALTAVQTAFANIDTLITDGTVDYYLDVLRDCRLT